MILLLEGLTEEILYLSLLKRLYNANEVDINELPKVLGDFLSPLKSGRTRIKSLVIKSLMTYAIVINCGGYERIKTMLKLLLRRSELRDIISNFDLSFVIIADKDKEPLASIRDS